jgi:hypothetical protein
VTNFAYDKVGYQSIKGTEDYWGEDHFGAQ